MSRQIRTFIPTMVTEKLNNFYDPASKGNKEYTISDTKLNLFALDYVMFYPEDDDPSEDVKHSDSEHWGVLFWAKSDNPDDALIELATRVVSFIDLMDKCSENEQSWINGYCIIGSPNDFPRACEEWVKSIDPTKALINGSLNEAFELVESLRYKFRKHCELINNLTEYIDSETLYETFTTLIEGK